MVGVKQLTGLILFMRMIGFLTLKFVMVTQNKNRENVELPIWWNQRRVSNSIHEKGDKVLSFKLTYWLVCFFKPL